MTDIQETNDPEIQALLDEYNQLYAARLADEADSKTKQIAELKLKISDERTLQETIKKYGPVGVGVHAIYTRFGIVVVHKPAFADYRTYQMRGDSTQANAEAMDGLVQTCLAAPSLEAFRKIEMELPAITGNLAAAISLLAGIALSNTTAKS